LGLEPDFIIGHSVGEIGCAYCDGCFTAEEAILVAYARGLSNNESKTILGGMAAIGKHHKELAEMLPEDIDIACHNALDSTTISGPAKSITAFVSKLTTENVFAREIACSGVPLHSRYIKDMGKLLNQMLNEIITNPKQRSPKWLSSTYGSESTEESQFSSATYHTKNLLAPVLFEEVVAQLPDCMTIEMAPHGLLKPILKRSMKEGTHFSLTQRGEKNGAEYLMKTLGE
jgi:fatty acid synthase, animal type